MTTTITPAVGVVPRLVELAENLRADGERLAVELADMPTTDDLTRAEEEILAQLADVRRRKTERVVAEHEQRTAVRAAAELDRLAATLREPAPMPGPDELLAATGIMPRSANPAGVHPVISREGPEGSLGVDGDPMGPPLIPEQVHPASPETVEAARRTGALPIVPDDPPPPGEVVATSGPTQTHPDPGGAAHPVPNPPTPAAPSPASLRGPRHKKGGRK